LHELSSKNAGFRTRGQVQILYIKVLFRYILIKFYTYTQTLEEIFCLLLQGRRAKFQQTVILIFTAARTSNLRDTRVGETKAVLECD
jgi:hypothetical protein